MKNLKKYIDFIVALATAISFIGVSLCLWAIVMLIAFHWAFDWFSWKILIVGGLPILLYLIMQANTLSYFIIYNEDYCNHIEKMGVSTFYDFFSCSFFGLCQCLSFKYVLHTKNISKIYSYRL